MKFVILFACVFAAVSALPHPTQHELAKRDIVSDHVKGWAQKLYNASEDVRQKLIAYRETHKDKWENEDSNKSRVTSAGLNMVLKGLELAQETFKEQILDHPERVINKLKNVVLMNVLEKVTDVMYQRMTPEVAAEQIAQEVAPETAIRGARY